MTKDSSCIHNWTWNFILSHTSLTLPSMALEILVFLSNRIAQQKPKMTMSKSSSPLFLNQIDKTETNLHFSKGAIQLSWNSYSTLNHKLLDNELAVQNTINRICSVVAKKTTCFNKFGIISELREWINCM